MKVLVILAIVSSSVAINLISEGELEDLFTKFVKKELSEEENDRLQDAFEILRRPSYFTTKADYSNTRITLDCIICRSAGAALFKGVNGGQSDEEMVEALSVLCISLGIQSENVCRGAVYLNLPIFNYIIRNKPEATPHAFCSLVLQSTADSSNCPHTDPRFEWQVELPEPVEIPQFQNGSSKPLKAVIVTDAHIDPYYEPYGVADCVDPTCCRKGQTPNVRKNLLLPTVDEHTISRSILRGNNNVSLDLDLASTIRELRSKSQAVVDRTTDSEPAGYWGDYRDCDSPVWAYDDVIENIAKHQDIDVVYYVGDSIDHHVWETTYDMIEDVNAYIIDKMRKSFGDDVLIVLNIGNHESQPTNQFAPSSVKEENLSTAWLYKSLADKWSPYLTEEAKATLLESGQYSRLVRPGLRVISVNNNVAYRYNWFAPSSVTEENLSTAWLYKGLVEKWGSYLTEEAKSTLLERGEFSMLIRPGLRVISLNNNVANRFNWWLVYDPLDAKNHLDWLIEELHKAELAGEKVHILAHIPPGVQDLTHTWTREYNRIVTRFASTIAAEFNGHTHSDEFKIFYSVHDGKPISMAWGGGSATAYSHYNLNYKIATINPGTFEPYNIVNYVYNLTEANLTPNRRPHWFQLYDIRNSFNLPDLSPETMDDLVHRMVTNKRFLLHLYAAFFSKLSDNRWPYCGTYCKIDSLCRTVVTVLWERQKCNELRDLFFR